MHIDASAPTRVDLAGGTIDMWPLYLFHAQAQTIHFAISLRAHARVTPRSDGRIVIESHDTDRKRLTPGVTTPAVDALIERAARAGATAAKVCGAGGGGCLICYAPPRSLPAVREALAAGGARVLDYRIETEGLRIWITSPSPAF